MFDHLGRARAEAAEVLELSPAPLIVLLPGGGESRLELEPPPAPAPWLEGKPCPVVLQAVWPQQRSEWKQSAYRVGAGSPERIPIFVYNFDPAEASGKLSVTGPKTWRLALAEQVTVPPGGRRELALTVDLREVVPPQRETLTIHGDFGPAGKTLLSLRLLPEPPKTP